MQKTRLVVVMLIFSLLVSVAGVFAQDASIAELAAGSDNFSTLVSLIEAAGLSDALAADGNLSVFAPTNEAFAALPEAVVEHLAHDADLLTAILTYHVVDGDVVAGDVATLNGDSVVVEIDDMHTIVDGVNVVDEIAASNGTIYVIDNVLIPTIELEEVDVFSVEGSVLIAGSSTVGPLTIAISNMYLEEGAPEESIPNIQITGTGGGFERFCVNAETDLSNASRPIKNGERDDCESNMRYPIEFRVGTDALAVAVSDTNDFLLNLTSEQLAFVFSDPRDENGEVTGARLWSDIDASFPANEIVRYIPDTDSGTFDYFVEAVYEGIYDDMEAGELEIADPFTAVDFLTADGENLAEAIAAAEDAGDEDLLETLETRREAALTSAILRAGNTQNSPTDDVLVNGIKGDGNAIGFFGFAYLEEGIQALNIDDVTPNQQTVDAATYPLARPLFVYGDAGILTAKPQVAAFMSFYLSNAEDIIIDVGYFPASKRAMNLSRLNWLAAVDMD